MSNGGAHTNFDAQHFGAGAIGCAVTLSAALAAGVMSLLNVEERDFSNWNLRQLLAGIVLSERRRGHELQRWQETVDELAEAQIEIRRLTREIAVMRVSAKH